MKRVNQMNSKAITRKSFNDKAQQMQEQWYPLRKGSMETVNTFLSVADEQDAFSLISTWLRLLQDDRQIEVHDLLVDYNFNVSWYRDHNIDVLLHKMRIEAGKQHQREREWLRSWLNKLGEYTTTMFNLSVVERSLAEKAREHWTYQQTCVKIGQRYKEKVQDMPADEYNRFIQAGSDEWAFAKFVGMKAVEIGRQPSVVSSLERRVHDARKEHGNHSTAPANPVEFRSAKYDALLEAMYAVLPKAEIKTIADGNEITVSTPPLMQPNEKGERPWRKAHNTAIDRLRKENREAGSCSIHLESELYKKTEDGSQEYSLLDTLPGGRDPEQEFNTKDEARMSQEKWERFRQSLSEQQRQCFDVLYNDPDLSDTAVAQRMGKTAQDIYNIRGRLKKKWEKLNDLP